ncbi:MAG: alpha-glucan family phosphorylase, partial [Chroococcidiopsis sp.]
ASGTSGQKVCFNGGINCSILDGWWREAYQQGTDGKGVNGWAIGEDCSLDDSEVQAQKDAESLYDLLTREIVPLFYDRTSPELPARWIAMMKASIKTAIPRFNTDRMVMEYVHQMYLSTADNAAPIVL